MFNKTRIAANDLDGLAAARVHLARLRENAAEIAAVQQSIRQTQASVAELRRQRGAAPDSQLNRAITSKSNELEVLADRCLHLQAESIQLRRSAGDFIGALNSAANAAIERAQADFRARFVAAVQALIPLLAEGAALGAAGAVQIGEACRSVVIPDPKTGGFFPMLGGTALIHDGILAAELSAETVNESAHIEEIRSQRAAAYELQQIVSRLEAEERVQTEAADARKRAERPLFSGARLGGMPSPEPTPTKLFPRTEYSGAGYANMHPAGAASDAEPSTSKSFGTHAA